MLAQRYLLKPTARLHRARHVTTSDSAPVWLFDLDNTLHDTSYAIFPRIDQAMTRAIAETLNVDLDRADILRKQYWKRYGATLIGMVKEHGVNPHDFLQRSHDFDICPLVRAETSLAYKLRQLPGRKILVTNAPFHYARRILKHLGILRQFDSLWAIEQMRLHGEFRPKPSPALLRYILAREGIRASHAVLVEDTLANLRGARQVGLRTAHIYHPGTPYGRSRALRPGYVDLRVNSVSALLLRRTPLRSAA